MNKILVAILLACSYAGIAGTVSYSIPILTVKSDVRSVIKGSGQLHRCSLSLTETTNTTPVKVSIQEDVPVGTGNAMRSSVWLAVTTAALTMNRDLSGATIRFETSGHVDGPSAGGMVCLAVMSAIEGRAFPDDFAMTGTIMADGTVGPVGGIAEKIKAASKSGIKRVCIPAFARLDDDFTDLLELGKDLKIEVYQVATINDAYQILHRLPARQFQQLNSVGACRLPSSVESALRSCFVPLATGAPSDKNVWDAFLGRSISEYKAGLFGAAVMHVIEGFDKRSLDMVCVEHPSTEHYPVLEYELPTNSNSAVTISQYSEALMKLHSDLKGIEEVDSDELDEDGQIDQNPKVGAKVDNELDWFDDYVESPSASQFVTLVNYCLLRRCMLDMTRHEISREIDGVRDWDNLNAEQLNAIRARLVAKINLLLYSATLDEGGENYDRLNNLYMGLADSIPYIRPNSSVARIENVFYCTMKAIEATMKENGLLDGDNELVRLCESSCGIAEATHARRNVSEISMLRAVFTDVQTLATFCALSLAADIRENSAFFNSVVLTARDNAIANIMQCQKMGIPSAMPIIYFQTAESVREGGSIGDDEELNRVVVLEAYIHVSLAAKALALCFSGRQPELNSKGYCSKISTVYDDGGKLKVRYYGVNGEPVLRDGFSGYRQEFGEGGVKVTYWLDLEGRDARFKSTNECWVAEYDTYDRCVRKTYCDISWRHVPNRDGVLFETFEYDAAGNRISREFFGASSNHVNCADGVAVIKSLFNKRGQETYRRFYDTGGQAVLHKDGNAGFDIVYDKRGNQRLFTYVDTTGNPVMTISGYAKEERKYNAYDCELEKSWFDEHGKLVAVDGVARIRTGYDDNKNPIEIAYFDTNDCLTCCAENYAVVRCKYNHKGEMIECHCFGLDGKPTMHRNGFSSWKDVFDASGRNVGRLYYDVNGKQIDANVKANAEK